MPLVAGAVGAAINVLVKSGGAWRLLLLALMFAAGIALGRLAKSLRGIQRMQQQLQGVPAPAPPSQPLHRWLHEWLGPVLPLYRGTPWEVMRQWVADCPPIVRIRILLRPCVIVGSAAGLKRIFQTKQRLYEKDLGFSYHPFLPILGSGLVTANGSLWQAQRVLIGPALRMDILDDVVNIAKSAVDRLSKKLARAKGTGKPVDMEEEFRLLTLQVIGEAILGLHHDECDQVFPQLYLPVMEEANLRVLAPWREYLPTPAWWLFNSRMRHLNSYILGLLRKRWSVRRSGLGPEKPDVLERILAAVEERGEAWDSKLEKQLCYEIKTFLLAGHETSAAMLTWTLYELTQHPDALAKVKDEAVKAFGQDERHLSRDAVEEMTYTVSALKESLRKYSVVPVVVRQLSADDELEGHPIPAGTTVICHLQAVHHAWKSPESWRPQRFMPHGEYDSFDEDVRQYMFVPFIQGPRNCLGQFFALLEARVVLALLVKRFKFRNVRRDAGERHPLVIPVGPKHGMQLLVD